MRLVASILFIWVMISPAFASQEEIDTAYHEYRNAQQNGDLRGALGHAETAYNAAIREWSRGTPSTYRYVAALARAQNDLMVSGSASRTVAAVVRANKTTDEWPRFSFEVFFEAGRAARGNNDFQQGFTLFQQALEIAEAGFGSDSLRAGYAHMEIARTYPDFTTIVAGDDLRNRVIGSGIPQHGGNQVSLNRATEIFQARQESVIELQILETIRAGNFMARGDMRRAGEVLEPAIQVLADHGFMNDYTLGLYIDWIASHLTQWPTRTMEAKLVQALEYGLLRQEGNYLPLARTYGFRHRRACVDRTPNGYLIIEYSISETGQVPRTEIVDTNMPNYWEPVIRRGMRGWVFVPAQTNGQPVRTDGVRQSLTMGIGNSC